MPFGDGTGPIGRGPGRGSGFGRGRGAGRGGSFGDCVCTGCGYKTKKQPALPCRSTKCPKCGVMMVKE